MLGKWLTTFILLEVKLIVKQTKPLLHSCVDFGFHAMVNVVSSQRATNNGRAVKGKMTDGGGRRNKVTQVMRWCTRRRKSGPFTLLNLNNFRRCHFPSTHPFRVPFWLPETELGRITLTLAHGPCLWKWRDFKKSLALASRRHQTWNPQQQTWPLVSSGVFFMPRLQVHWLHQSTPGNVTGFCQIPHRCDRSKGASKLDLTIAGSEETALTKILSTNIPKSQTSFLNEWVRSRVFFPLFKCVCEHYVWH